MDNAEDKPVEQPAQDYSVLNTSQQPTSITEAKRLKSQ